MTPFEKFIESEHRLNEGLIRLEKSLNHAEGTGARPNARMATMTSFLAQCGNPQRGIPAVHVAGTSGKGSVSAGIAGILQEAGLKVGLHVSPYLQVSTEKIVVNGRLLSARDFADLVDWVMPIARPFLSPETPASIHGMASVAIAFEAFRRERVDVIVCEAGCGARYDLTNFLDTEVAVLTNVGRDHLQSLGPTLEDVAWHKAGVGRSGKPLITGASGSPLDVIRKEATRMGAGLIEIPTENTGPEINRRIAAAAAGQMARTLDTVLTEEIISRGFHRISLPGRSEVLSNQHPPVILDGAHNEDKLAVALRMMTRHLPPNCPVTAVVGFLGSKAGPSLIHPFLGKVRQVVATEPRVLGKIPFPATATKQLFLEAGIPAEAVSDPDAALDRALLLADGSGAVFITGSFYLAGALRRRWYPAEQVLLQQTSWPT